jgi:hypothetical protein
MLVAASGCTQSPAPPVAQAYANQYGPVESSRFTPCPKVKGVWKLSNLSAGSLLKDDGEIVEHFRWYARKLFNLTIASTVYIAIDDRGVDTVLYLSDGLPASAVKKSLSYTTLSDKEMPCLGHGWRQFAVVDHSLNDAAARVLGLVPGEPKRITQTDYLARNSASDLLVAIRIDFQGTNAAEEPVKSGYWHFLKMPRLHENPKEMGFPY